MGARETTSPGEVPAVEGRRHEILGILAGTATVLALLALGSYHLGASKNLVGPAGVVVARGLVTAFGMAAWLVPAELALLTLRLFGKRETRLGVVTLGSTLVIVLVGCALVHLLADGQTVFGGHRAGGAIGALLGEVLKSLLGMTGTLIIGFAVLLITIVIRTPWSLEDLTHHGATVTFKGWRKLTGAVHAVLDAWREARVLDEELPKTQGPTIVGVDTVALGEAIEQETLDPEEPGPLSVTRRGEPESTADDEPKIVAPKPTRQEPIEALTVAPLRRRGSEVFELPPLDLLDEVDASEIRVDAEHLRDNAQRLTEKLAAYGVYGRVDEIHPGPVVTMYEFEPQSGTKVSKIAGLADDLAMALAAQKVRIVAPIPGKARVGFELPNADRQTVSLREILEDRRWQQHDGALPIALGKDIAGQPVYADLAKMPHLLVAGATGSGKSVALNVMICSILTKKTPDQVRMLMVDPKVVELQGFDEIPHMLLPVVTDMKKATLSLRWAVDEMERRYQLFANAGTRNIGTYNRRVERVDKGELKAQSFFVKKSESNQEEVEEEATPERLPYVVVVVDEFADLMMVAAKDVETCIARLAQKARAAGIHVILATQRPSVDVITGMIKANFPARVAFKTSQRQDSMTILGRQGAENLLGMGDMLILPPGSSELQRVHAAYVSEDEVSEVCDFLRDQADPVYQEEIVAPRRDDTEFGQADDPLYDRAVEVVADAGYCSISHVQRQLSIGYNKAAKLVERMEVEGVVGPPSSKAGGRREVLVGAL